MYFAARDIIEDNLKVSAGRPLPDRFQSYEAVKNIRKILGADAVLKLDSTTEGFVLVDAKQLLTLQQEHAAMKEQLAGRRAKKDN